MPKLSVWFIRASLIYLLLGFTLGGLILFHKGVPLHPIVWRFYPSHVDFMLFGWTAQLIMGVAYWILPRLLHPPKRGNPYLTWFVFWVFNLGIWINLLASLILRLAWLEPVGDILIVLGVGVFLVQAWPRVRGITASPRRHQFGKNRRE